MPADDPTSCARPSGTFQTTQWSVVLAARNHAAPEARQSLEALCHQYWAPLFTFVRHRGYSEHDAQDLTQEFFTRLIEKDWLDSVERDRGRFRTFLLMALKRFLANEWDRSQTRKRGGGQRPISLDLDSPPPIADPRGITPDAAYEQRWALTLLETVIQRLKDELIAAGREHQYTILKPCLTAERGDLDYDTISRQLGLTHVATRTAVHRLRKRFRELFRMEIAATVADAGTIDEEFQSIVAALQRN